MKIERKLKAYQTGFTMIELIAFAVILYVVGAMTIPRFFELANAEQGTEIKNIASALTSMASLNHANNISYDAGLSNIRPVEVVSCQNVTALLEVELDKGYRIEAGQGVTIEHNGINIEGGSSSCFIAFDSNKDGVFNLNDEPRESFIAYGVRN